MKRLTFALACLIPGSAWAEFALVLPVPGVPPKALVAIAEERFDDAIALLEPVLQKCVTDAPTPGTQQRRCELIRSKLILAYQRSGRDAEARVAFESMSSVTPHDVLLYCRASIPHGLQNKCFRQVERLGLLHSTLKRLLNLENANADAALRQIQTKDLIARGALGTAVVSGKKAMAAMANATYFGDEDRKDRPADTDVRVLSDTQASRFLAENREIYFTWVSLMWKCSNLPVGDCFYDSKLGKY